MYSFRPKQLLLPMILGLFLLSGCASDEFDVPTLEGKSSENTSNLVSIAKMYYDCMTDSGVEMELRANREGQLTFVSFAPQNRIVMYSYNGSGGAVPETPANPEQEKMMDDFFSYSSNEARLVIDGMDYSEIFTRCMDLSGYDENAAYGKDAFIDNTIEMMRQVRVNNDWAECARENGFPGVKDSEMPTKKDGSEWPAVYLPGTITEDQLRKLLEVCPNYDKNMEDMRVQWMEENPISNDIPDALPPSPSIHFDFEEIPVGVDMHAEEERMSRLYEVLHEKMYEHWDEQSG